MTNSSQAQYFRGRWIIKGILAQSASPAKNSAIKLTGVLPIWIEQAKQFGIKSIICLLSNHELGGIKISQGIDLIRAYRDAGLEVFHLPFKDDENFKSELVARYKEAQKACLVHCQYGVSRSGQAIEIIAPTTKDA